MTADLPPCSGCRAEPVRGPKQRDGRKCHAASAKKYRREHFAVPAVRAIPASLPARSAEVSDPGVNARCHFCQTNPFFNPHPHPATLEILRPELNERGDFCQTNPIFRPIPARLFTETRRSPEGE
jgi:hypothetical protein